MNALEHTTYKLRNARFRKYPFPHFYCRNVFPEDFYWHIVKNLPPDDQYKETSFNHRRFGPEGDPTGFLHDRWFLESVLMTFKPWLDAHQRANYEVGEKVKVSTEVRLVRDEAGYKIGPHTDAPHKLVSLLFYLPGGWHDEMRNAGTSIYVPDDHEFTCKGGPHYETKGFHVVETMKFLPNTCFGFWKTNNSWHGVESYEGSLKRDVLLYNIYDLKIAGSLNGEAKE